MNSRQRLLFFVLFFSLIGLTACEKENEGGKNETKISHHASQKSHNAGQNCLECHQQGGGGEGWFNIAGTVYQASGQSVFPNATIKLYTGPDGTGQLKYTIEGDANGNFYSTENIDFGTGLFPAVENNSGTRYMPTGVQTGACNTCHGSTTGVIRAK